MKMLKTAAALMLGTLGSVASAADTDTLYWYLNSPLAEPPVPGFTWATVSVSDLGAGSGDVLFTVDINENLAGKIGVLGFNYDPSLAATGWSFSPGSNLGTTSMTVDPEGNKLDGYPYLFDIRMDFDTSLSGDRSFVLNLTGVDLDPVDFLFYAYQENKNPPPDGWFGSFQMGAHMQDCTGNIGLCGRGDSIWVGDSEGGGPPQEIPLPGAVWLFGSALVGLVTLQRRRRLAA